MKKINVLIGLLVICLASYASPDHQQEVKSSAEFERLKSLVGHWSGEMKMGEEVQEVKLEYRLTAGGSVLVETIFMDTPHEMVTVYHDNGSDKLSMTHYCMLGNQPRLTLVNVENNMMKFELAKDSDIDVANEPHMHSLALTLVDDKHIIQEWMDYAEGKPNKTNAIKLSRQ